VVGPRERAAVSASTDGGKVSVMTLALNQMDEGAPAADLRAANGMPMLLQFGLPPEDEAREVAQRAFSDGATRALVIAPDNEWGARLYDAFAAQWTALGGRILERVAYQPGTQDYATPVKDLLNINNSEFRSARLRELLGRRLQVEARMRQDADMIFMEAVPVSARQIVPQFQLFRADSIPVYTTSHAYTGVANAATDGDLDQVRFPDMPEALHPAAEQSWLVQKMNRDWSIETSAYRRLYALGVDAFQIIPQLGRLALQPGATYQGLTGLLQVGRDGRIHRRLEWAQFVNGAPRPLDQTVSR
jgi:uncharacterized protein